MLLTNFHYAEFLPVREKNGIPWTIRLYTYVNFCLVQLKIVSRIHEFVVVDIIIYYALPPRESEYSVYTLFQILVLVVLNIKKQIVYPLCTSTSKFN